MPCCVRPDAEAVQWTAKVMDWGQNARLMPSESLVAALQPPSRSGLVPGVLPACSGRPALPIAGFSFDP